MPQEQPLISVIVPVYKVEKYLDQCVESVVNQTYRNLEIILVDDGSPDRSPEMCDAWAKKDSRIKVVHKKNGGLGDARNAGVAIARGDYFGFIDSDDWCEPDMYQELLDSCVRFDAPVSVCNVFINWECGWPTEQTVFAKEKSAIERDEVLRRFFSDRLTAWAWNKLYHRDLAGILTYPKQGYEDIPVARELFIKVSSIAFTGKSLYHYRQRQGSIVNSTVNLSQYIFIEELRKNVELAREWNFEKESVARLSVSAFNFLEKIYSSRTKELECKIPALIEDVSQGRMYFKDLKTRKLDKFFMGLLAKGVSYKKIFAVRQLFQWFYRKLNLKKF